MKMELQRVSIASFTLAFAFQVYSQGYIVPNGLTYAGNVPGLGSEIHVIQNPTNSDYTGFFLTPEGKTQPTVYTNTFLFDPFLDEGVRTFLVSSNDPVSLQPIVAHNYPELTYPNNYVFADGSPFYAGFYTGYNPFDPHGNYTGIYTDPVFGWAEFVNNQGVIQLLDSALEYGGGGIYVGTQNIIPVPEPSAFVLGGLGAACVFLLRRGSRLWKAA